MVTINFWSLTKTDQQYEKCTYTIVNTWPIIEILPCAVLMPSFISFYSLNACLQKFETISFCQFCEVEIIPPYGNDLNAKRKKWLKAVRNGCKLCYYTNTLDQDLPYHTELDGMGCTMSYQFSTNTWYGRCTELNWPRTDTRADLH